jgi:hypothetical protein
MRARGTYTHADHFRVHFWFVCVTVGKYVGNRPIKLKRSNWDARDFFERRKNKTLLPKGVNTKAL